MEKIQDYIIWLIEGSAKGFLGRRLTVRYVQKHMQTANHEYYTLLFMDHEKTVCFGLLSFDNIALEGKLIFKGAESPDANFNRTITEIDFHYGDEASLRQLQRKTNETVYQATHDAWKVDSHE